MLDTLCQNYYGHLNGTVEAVLDANQGLADEVQPYRAGVVIHLPDVVGASEEGVCCGGTLSSGALAHIVAVLDPSEFASRYHPL